MRADQLTRLLSAFVCPRCGGPLSAAVACVPCGVEFPAVGDVPCLVPEPGLWRALWIQHLDEYLSVTAARLAEISTDSVSEGLLPRTEERLVAMMRAIGAERETIERLLSPLRQGANTPPGLMPQSPGGGRDLAVLHGFEALFRDWVWGGEESSAALRFVERLAAAGPGSPAPRTVAVFGAGAGRLAADVHGAFAPSQTVALDVNPLPLLVAAELARGNTVRLHEFPVGPRTAADVAVLRELRCPAPVGAGLTFVLADALRPPLPSGSQDLVITPWFIDAAGVDVRVTAAAVSRVLRLGGVWLNLGPLRFSGPAARLYAIEEVLEIVAGAGFEVGADLREQVPYFASPSSGSHRVEMVYGFAARKTREAGAVALPAADPPWVTDARLPIPALPQFAATQRSAVFTAGILSLIDGTRSLAQLAAALGQSWGLPPQALEDQLRAFLLRLTRS